MSEGILLKPEAFIKCVKDGDTYKTETGEIRTVDAEEKGLLFVKFGATTPRKKTSKKTVKKTEDSN